MSQRRMVPSTLPGYDCVDSGRVDGEKNAHTHHFSQSRRSLSYLTVMLNLMIVGAVHGWTTCALLSLTSESGGVSQVLTNDEASWMVPLTVLGSMIGSLVATPLCGRIGRKNCLVFCNAIFMLSWLIMFVESSNRNIGLLYIIRLCHGISIGIVHKMHPIYISEIDNIEMRHAILSQNVLFVFSGTLYTASLGLWITHQALLLFLLLMSFISLLFNIYIPETPYCLLIEGRLKEALQAAKYYKGVVEREKVITAIRAERRKKRYGLHQGTKYGHLPTRHNLRYHPTEHEQSESDLSLESYNDLESQSRSYLPSSSSTNLPSPSRRGLPSPSRRGLSPPSRKGLSPPFGRTLSPPSRKRLLSTSRKGLSSSYRRGFSSRFTRGSSLPPRRSLPPPSTRGLSSPYRRGLSSSSRRGLLTSTTRVFRASSVPDIRSDAIWEVEDTETMSNLHFSSSSDSDSQSKSVMHSEVICEVHAESTGELRLLPSRYSQELPTQPTHELHPQSTSYLPLPSTSDLASPSTSDLPSPSTSDLPSPSRTAIILKEKGAVFYKSRSDSPSPSRSDIPSPSRPAINLEEKEAVFDKSRIHLFLKSRSDLPSPSKRALVLREKRAKFLQSISNSLSPSRSDLPSASRSDLPSASRSDLPLPSTSDLPLPSTSDLPLPSTSDLPSPSRSDFPSPSKTAIILQEDTAIFIPSRSDIPSPSRIDLPSSSRKDLASSSRKDLSSSSKKDLPSPSRSKLPLPFRSDFPSTSRSALSTPPGKELPSTPRSAFSTPPGKNLTSSSRKDLQSRRDLHRQSNVASTKSPDIDDYNVDDDSTDTIQISWSSKLQDILQGTNRKALFIMFVLIMAQHLSGNFITMQYLAVFFNNTRISIGTYLATILVLIARVLSGTFSTLSLQTVGRLTIMMVSTLGVCFTLTILSIYLYLDAHEFDVSKVTYIPPIVIGVYQIMYQLGLGIIPNVLLCELFLSELQDAASIITAIFDGIIGFTVSKLYQVITDIQGPHVIYITFTVSSFFALAMVSLCMPETKGKTYYEIEAYLHGKDFESSKVGIVIDRREIHKL